MEKAIAIIPARSGSKGLKDKNILELKDKPLMVYTIEAAINSKIFDTVHVSTDSEKYLNIAKNAGADEPFLREPENSSDSSSTWDAVREVLKKYENIGKKFDYCVLLQPTSPLRTASDIKNAFELFKKNNALSLTSVTETDHPVQWCFELENTDFMTDFSHSLYKDCRRQELKKHYRENGAIYIVKTKDIADPDFDFYNERCVAYKMDKSSSIDIDDLTDFYMAQALLDSKEKKDEK